MKKSKSEDKKEISKGRVGEKLKKRPITLPAAKATKKIVSGLFFSIIYTSLAKNRKKRLSKKSRNQISSADELIAEIFSAEHMKMKVLDRLATVVAAVRNNPVPVR